MTYICVLISGDGDELRLREDKGLSFGREEGILRTVLLHLHDVKTRLILVQRLEHYHLEERRGTVSRESFRDSEGNCEDGWILHDNACILEHFSTVTSHNAVHFDMAYVRDGLCRVGACILI